ncbi:MULTISPECIES: hypothetical protein [Paracoccaceae]|uniref:hypothetical protein n=1 Tax=Paracoccaceae TaxID=31989 RepID=UPI0035B25962
MVRHAGSDTPFKGRLGNAFPSCLRKKSGLRRFLAIDEIPNESDGEPDLAGKQGIVGSFIQEEADQEPPVLRFLERGKIGDAHIRKRLDKRQMQGKVERELLRQGGTAKLAVAAALFHLVDGVNQTVDALAVEPEIVTALRPAGLRGSLAGAGLRLACAGLCPSRSGGRAGRLPRRCVGRPGLPPGVFARFAGPALRGVLVLVARP